MSSCSGADLSALVDGALTHTERDRVHSHLAACDPCRAELEQLRAVKSRLSALGDATPPPSSELQQRLRALAVPGVEPSAGRSVPRPVGAPPGGAPVGPSLRRPADGRPPARPPVAARPRRTARTRRAGTVGGGVLLVGVGLALVLGGPPPSTPSTPVDPGSDAFVVDFVSTTGDVPLADPAGRAALLPQP